MTKTFVAIAVDSKGAVQAVASAKRLKTAFSLVKINAKAYHKAHRGKAEPLRVLRVA